MAEYKPENCAYCSAATWCEIRSNGRPQCRACKIERFFEHVLYPPLDLRLIGWQRKVLRELYGTVEPADGLRQYRRALIEVPKKNGKSFLIGGLPLYHLLMEDTEIRPEAYGAAGAKEQAAIVFRSAATLVRANADLWPRFRILESTKRIIRRDGHGTYVVLSADGDINDGIEPSLALVDELHRWKTARAHELYTVLSKGMISRREPLMPQITTAGTENESPIWSEEHDAALQILRGENQSRRFYVAMWSADQKRMESDPEYWKSREARVEANPSHEDNGGFLKDEAIVEELNKALTNPVRRSEYLRFHLNIKVTSTQENVIDMAAWRACGGGIDLRTWPSFGEEDLRQLIAKWRLANRPCWVGVDASWTTDFTGVTVIFPPSKEEDRWTILPFAFIPSDKVPELSRKTRRNELAQWVKQGFLTATPGNAVDTSAIKERIRWASDQFEVREIPFDPWNFRNVAGELEKERLKPIEVRQGYGSLSEATKKLLEIYETGKLRHGNHPVLNWHASCLALQGDRKDNVQPAKPERGKSTNRIDLISAAVTAMSRAVFFAEKRKPLCLAGQNAA